MKFQHFIKLSALAALAGTSIIEGGSAVSAAPQVTNGTIQYVEDSNNNETVDPTPGEDGGDVVVPPAQEGSFAIAYAPSFDFGP